MLSVSAVRSGRKRTFVHFLLKKASGGNNLPLYCAAQKIKLGQNDKTTATNRRTDGTFVPVVTPLKYALRDVTV